MKGAIKTVTISGKNYDIRKEGASLAIECQSIFITLIKDSGTSLDAQSKGLDLMSSMTRDIVTRIKQVFIECIASPKMTSDSFESLPHSSITPLFMEIYHYQTAEAEDKKKGPSDPIKSATNSEKKN